jgi:hypothetical protein
MLGSRDWKLRRPSWGAPPALTIPAFEKSVERRVRSDQLASYFEAHPRKRNQLSPDMRRFYRVDEDKWEEPSGNFAHDNNRSSVCIVVTSFAKLFHALDAVFVQMRSLPAFARIFPIFVLLQSVGVSYEMQDGLPAV